MRRKVFAWAVALAIGMPILGVSLVSIKAGYESRGRESLGSVPSFALVERNGSGVRREDLLGKVWVASFIFTRCEGVCPMLNKKMEELQTEFGKDPHFRMVSFSVDPENDTPEVLAEYAPRFHASPSWLFLTGERSELKDLLQNGFHVMMPGFETRDVGMITHSNKFVLVDRNGVIRGLYDGDEDAESWLRLRRHLYRYLGRRF